MYKFIYIKDNDNNYDNSNITFEVDYITAPEIIEEFKRFLLAVGFAPETVVKNLGELE